MTSASYLPAIAIHAFPRYVGSLVLGDHVFFFALFWEHISFGGFENQKMSVLYPPTCLVVWIYNSRFRNISLRIVKWVLHCLLVSIVDVKKSNVISSPPPLSQCFQHLLFLPVAWEGAPWHRPVCFLWLGTWWEHSFWKPMSFHVGLCPCIIDFLDNVLPSPFHHSLFLGT